MICLLDLLKKMLPDASNSNENIFKFGINTINCFKFNHSAHSPMPEEPERIQQILHADIVAGMNNLSEIK